jgi:hypothetical protein
MADIPEKWVTEALNAKFNELERYRSFIEAGRGKWRVIALDSYDPGAGPIIHDYSSEQEAIASEYWQIKNEREWQRLMGAGKKEEARPFFHPGPPTPEFLANLEQEVQTIKAGASVTAEELFFYDPQGNNIDRVKV